MTKEHLISSHKETRAWLSAFTFLVLALSTRLVCAQPAITAESIGLGGGGTAYLNGPETTFWNPANLMISDRPGNFHIGIGQSALQYKPVLAGRSLQHQLSNFIDGYQPYERKAVRISPWKQNRILNTHFPDHTLRSQNSQRADMVLAGALWQRKDYALSIALRARYASMTTTGRGWYDDRFIEQNDRQVRDFTLSQRRSEFYELAVGYAQEFTFINGLIPRLNKLYIGISPKIILAGPTFQADYKAQYLREDKPGIRHTFISDFKLHSSGNFSRLISDYLQVQNPRDAVRQNLSWDYQFQPTGYGVGFDFGFNYVIPLNGNSPASAGSTSRPPLHKSLRLAFSLNDIGAIRYYDQPLALSSPADTAHADLQASSNTIFVGTGGQYINHLHQAKLLPNPLLAAPQRSENNYTSLLPTSLNAGLLLDLSQLRFMGDISLGLNNSAFTKSGLSAQLGAEFRPVQQVPIRLGTRFAAEQPFQMGFGTGIETEHWDFAISARALFYRESSQTTIGSGAFGGLQLHF
ncbi:DUF5723 family protein [Fodinibius sediminis]|uniref:DUF5723 domain-containing protein n=1 Tax=Fodinibius sediminis TaxID=1214077 RepID=A0A521B5A3_9BACT|nr:DUF5723 family protein [Fodinibius sediminis]SMO42272.1 hypothetical protein SAMN06265218_102209 [Fodinibius sediminis]